MAGVQGFQLRASDSNGAEKFLYHWTSTLLPSLFSPVELAASAVGILMTTNIAATKRTIRESPAPEEPELLWP
jgi:hypothetical protein